MTTIINSAGRLIGLGDGTLVQGLLTPYGKLFGVKAVRSTSVDPAAGVDISFESALYDTGGFIAAFPTTNIVIPVTAWYSVICYVNTPTDTAHTGLLQIFVNGVEIRSKRNTFNAANGMLNALVATLSGYPFTKGDVVKMRWDSNGTSLAMQTGGEAGCSCSVWRVG
jgi:hypothetical protein